MNFRISGLDPAPFAPLFELDDETLRAEGIDRHRAGATDTLPCRVSLADAGVGEELLLLPYAHLAANSPYRASGPIYVRRGAEARAVHVDHIPPVLASRLLSVRAYDENARMVDADVAPGADVQPLIERLLALPEVARLHIHFARRGCYAALVERARA